MRSGDVTLDAEFHGLITGWAVLWGVPALPHAVSIRFSKRLKRSLGRCRPAEGLITIRADLRDGDPERLREVLCHEVAHVATRLKFGSGTQPHGMEWRELVTVAGYKPRVRMAGSSAQPKPRAFHPPLSYEHRCPVCHCTRLAHRRMPRWRCAECLDAGLDGTLVITRRLTPTSDLS